MTLSPKLKSITSLVLHQSELAQTCSGLRGGERRLGLFFEKYGLSHSAFAKLFLVGVGEALLAGVVPSDRASNQTSETPCVLSCANRIDQPESDRVKYTWLPFTSHVCWY